MEKVTFKDLRVKSKLTQEELAKKSGYSKDYISMIERGERRPSDKAKEVFAKMLEEKLTPSVQIFLAIQRTKSTTNKMKQGG